MRVCHIVDDDRWDLSHISMDLPDIILDRIHSLHPPSDENRDDMFIPSFTTPKGLSLSKACEAQIHTPCINVD